MTKCNHILVNSLELHYIDTDSIIFTFGPIKGLIEDLKDLKEVFNRTVVGKMKLETTLEIDLEEAVFFRE